MSSALHEICETDVAVTKYLQSETFNRNCINYNDKVHILSAPPQKCGRNQCK